MTFKEIKNADNDANLSDGSDGFNATTNGKSVLMFSRQFSEDIQPKDVSLTFDGIDDALDLGEHIDIDENNFTIEFWAQRSITNTAQMLLSQDPDETRRGLQIGFNEDNTFSFGYYGDLLTTPTSYSDTNWHHWACSYASVLPDDDVEYGPKVISLAFDGNDDFVDVTDPLPLDDDFTIEFWAKQNKSAFQTMIGQGIRENNKGLHIGFLDDNRFTFGFYNNDLITDEAFPDVAWHHWACSYKNIGPYQVRDIALSFDGYDDQVNVPSGVWINGDFTIESWVYVKRRQSRNSIISFSNGPGVDMVEFGICYGTNNYWDTFPYIIINNSKYLFQKALISLDTWLHCAVTLEGKTAKLYYNGNLVTSVQISSPPADVKRTQCFMGVSSQYVNYNNVRFNGKMDDLRIWNRALTMQELRDQMETQLAGSESGLMGYWQFNESKGRVAKDSSGNGNDATLINMIEPPWTFENPDPIEISKPKERYVEFDGNNDMLEIPYAKWFNGDLTIEAWIKPRSIKKAWNRLMQLGQEGVNNVFLSASGENTIPTPGFGYYSNGLYEKISAPDPIDLNEWAHVAATIEGKTIRLYINGQQVATKTTTQVPDGSDRTDNVIGKAYYDQAFDGFIDDLRIWSVARSQEQIENNKDIELTGNETDLIAYWKFNETNGQVDCALDSTPNKRHAHVYQLFSLDSFFKPLDFDPHGISAPWHGNVIPSLPKERTYSFRAENKSSYAFGINNISMKTYTLHDYFTVEFWFKPYKTSGVYTLYEKYEMYSGRISYGNFEYRLQPNWNWITAFPVEENKWYHVAVVYDGEKQKVYKNGEMVVDRNQTGSRVYYLDRPFVLGKSTDASNQEYEGEMDDFRIWTTARTQEEIFNNKDRPLTGNETGLVAYWPFDEKTGYIFYDYSPNQIHLRTVAGASRESRLYYPHHLENVTHNWLTFDGKDDYLTVPDGVWFDGGDFTIEAWVYLDDYTTWSKVIDFGNGEFTDNVTLSVSEQETGKPALQIYGDTNFGITSSDAIPMHTWTHLSATLSGDSASIYINGTEVATGTVTEQPKNVNRTKNYIGQSNTSTDSLFKGKLDDIRIWSVARPVESLGRPVTGNEAGLIGYWQLSEKTGAIAKDSSSSAKDVTLVNMDTANAWGYVSDEEKPTQRAISFDGKDDHLTLPPGVYFDGDFTIETWVYLRSYGEGLDMPTILDISNGYRADQIWFYPAYYGLEGGGAYLEYIVNNTSNGYNIATNLTQTPLFTWTHLAVTFEVTPEGYHHLCSYKNGRFERKYVYTDLSNMISPPKNVIRTINYIGDGIYPGRNLKLNGKLDDLRIWSVAKTADEILAGYTKTLTGNEPNLTAYWKFDETSGNIAYDSSPNGHHATLVNMDTQNPWQTSPVEIRSNPKEIALELGKGSYAKVEPDEIWFRSEMKFIFTIEAWVYLKSYLPWSTILEFGKTSPRDSVAFYASDGSLTGKPCFYMNFQEGGYVLYTDQEIPLNQWTHLAVTFDESLTARIYIDGVEVASKVMPKPPTEVLCSSSYIGSEPFNTGYLDGYIDDLRIWNVVRTPEQLINNKERPLVGNETGLMGYWPFDDGSDYNIMEYASGRLTEKYNCSFYYAEKQSFPNLKHVHLSAKQKTYVEIPHRKILNPVSELTVEAWVKPIQSGNNIIAGKFNPEQTRGYILRLNGSQEVIADIWDDTGSKHSINLGGLTISTWSHVAVTWQQNGKFAGYVNGTQTALENASQEKISSTADPFFISYHSNIAQTLIDEVRVWSVVRSSDQIQESMNKRLIGVENALIGYWRLDEAQGDVIKDSSLYYSHGYMHTKSIDNAWAIETRSIRTVYRDGVVIAIDEPSQPYSSSGGLTLGATPWSTEFFNGQLDEIRVWDDIRTPDEIASSLGKRLTPSEEQDLIRYWRIDEATGDTIADLVQCGLTACDSLPITNQGQLIGSQNSSDNWSNKVYERIISYDGKSVASDKVVTTYAASGNMIVGKSTLDKDYFKGNLDELRFWRSTRLGSTLSHNKDIRLTGDDPDLSAYYRLDRQGMPYLEDSSGNFHYGAMLDKTASKVSENWRIDPSIIFPISIGDLNKELACVRVVQTRQWYEAHSTDTAIVAKEITSTAHGETCPHNGYMFRPLAYYNINIHDRDTMMGPIIPVNIEVSPGDRNDDFLVVWYEMHDGASFSYTTVEYTVDWPHEHRVVVASRYGSEGCDTDLTDQTFPDAHGITQNYLDVDRYTKLAIYNQSDQEKAGYNPNEEHGMIVPSFKYEKVTPRPNTAYGLRNDINITTRQANVYTSDPYVLVEYLDTVIGKYQMAAFSVDITDTAAGYVLNYTMNAGVPVIPPYPLDLVIGSSFPSESFGKKGDPAKRCFWEDHKGQPWALSGDSHLFTYFWYPLQPDQWYQESRYGNDTDLSVKAPGDGTGDVSKAVPWLPVANVQTGEQFPDNMIGRPKAIEVRYNTKWPSSVPIIKAGETLTFSGGEYRTDHSTSPGLPGVLAWSAGQVVYDDLNKAMDTTDVFYKYTLRLAPVLLERTVDFPIDKYPEALKPAGKLVDVVGARWYFKELDAGIKSRLFYDSMDGKLGICGFVNNKTLGDKTLTAAPPALYVLQPNIMTERERDAIKQMTGAIDSFEFKTAVDELYKLSRNPTGFDGKDYTVGLDEYKDINDDIHQTLGMNTTALGPGLAVLPNAALLDPVNAFYSAFSEGYVVLAENNHKDLGALPVSLHIVKVVKDKYRGAIKPIYSDNVFDEKISLRHTGDFGAKADEMIFEWWYREENGVSVDTPDANPYSWRRFPDPSGNNGAGHTEVSMMGAGAALLVDNLFYARYRHSLCEPTSISNCWSDWAGAANSRPGDYQAQLAEGWVKRVINAVNPYEARITSFNNIDNPATYVSMIQQAGQRYEGPVALNPDKDIIENFGLIELYQTVLDRAKDLSINLEEPVSTPGIVATLLLASSRIADFYKILGDEAYTDALDPTIGYASDSVSYGTLAPTIFSFMNQVPTLLDEELALLRGLDDLGARPSYNRLMWNFTKSKGEVAYANAYGIWDFNKDGFIDELDAQSLFPQSHGDAWGHYLSGLKGYYDLLSHPFFTWKTRSELFGMQGVVIDVDYLDESTFAALAAAKAKAGAEIMNLTYRERYVENPQGQFQGYEDSDESRSWGVTSWGRRCFQGAYFDWLTANTLLPPDAEALTKTGMNKIDRKTITGILDIVSGAQIIQQEFDNANTGLNPLGLAPDAVAFDIDPTRVVAGSRNAATHFEQIYERASKSMKNAKAIFDHANKTRKSIREIAISAENFAQMVIDKDRDFRNRLIEIFGSPYDGTIGPGKAYPAGYAGPDYYYYQYVDVYEYSSSTVAEPSEKMVGFFSEFKSMSFWNKEVSSQIYNLPEMFKHFMGTDISKDDYVEVDLKDVLEIDYPINASSYCFDAPDSWGFRDSPGEIQKTLIELIKTETQLQLALAEYSLLMDDIGFTLEVMQARSNLHYSGIQVIDKAKNQVRSLNNEINKLQRKASLLAYSGQTAGNIGAAIAEGFPKSVGTSNDATSAGRSAAWFVGLSIQEVLFGLAAKYEFDTMEKESDKELINYDIELQIAKENYSYEIQEILKELEALLGTEAITRMEVFHKQEAMRKVAEQYRAILSEGLRLLEEREEFNKQVASKTQKKRYMDMALRLNMTSALSKYRNAFDTAARYVYLAAKAYDYETNLSANDPASARPILTKIIKRRTLGQYENNQWIVGQGGLGEVLTSLKDKFDMLKGQMGFNNPQTETGRFSLRSELFRIKGSDGKTGAQNDQVWQQTLMNHQVEDLWEVAEFHKFCRAFAPRSAGPQPGIVIPFTTKIIFGKNFFGWPLSGGDHTYDPTNYATKVRSVGTWFDGYNNGLLSETPRVFLVPAGMDIMLVPDSFELDARNWLVVDQKIPVPFSVESADLINPDWIPSLDSLDGFLTKVRRYSSFRAYHDSGYFNQSEMVYDSRLVGRSVWNSNWVMIIPGGTLHYDADYGLEMFIQTVKDIKLFFETYAISGM